MPNLDDLAEESLLREALQRGLVDLNKRIALIDEEDENEEFEEEMKSEGAER